MRARVPVAALSVLVATGGIAMAASARPAEHPHLGVPWTNTVGGRSGTPADDPEVVKAAAFAVAEHDRQSGQRLALGQVVDADEQIVAGTRYILTIEAAGPSGTARYEAQVWVKPWENSRQLTDFRAL
ncbi:cystatin domain-containing protein [Streptomyces sp. HUAS TT7]|uniref:cystatin domain-containing protein n=1 Tax=Streptomyces sp. HUAS TT7 TaxID=3447507 RepID=UPI003F66098F